MVPLKGDLLPLPRGRWGTCEDTLGGRDAGWSAGLWRGGDRVVAEPPLRTGQAPTTKNDVAPI